MKNKKIIFVPGMNPKPEPSQHRKMLWRSMLEGIRRSDPEMVDEIRTASESFELIPWNYLYYQRETDFSRDLPWIDALINKHGPTAEDIVDAQTMQRRLAKFLFDLGDMFPFLIPLFPKIVRDITNDLRRYFRNQNNIACDVRELLKAQLRPLLAEDARILLIGHSLGSVIAYDTLWELSRLEQLPGRVDLFLTLGSPLGLNYVQRRLLGKDREGEESYPGNIRRWVNISSVGDITALDREFRKDFSRMMEFGIIDSIEDHSEAIYNFFRSDAGLNVHRSYGYLVNPAVGVMIADWWRRN